MNEGEGLEGGRFDTDAGALERRLEAHKRYSSADINAWIFQHLEVDVGMSVLELGCGSGHQTIPLANMVGERGSVLAVDVSGEALARLTESAEHGGLLQRIEILEADFSELDRMEHARTFERVLAAFSLYYAKDPRGLMQVIAEHLLEGGIFFFCGPARGNNFKMKQFHYDLLGIDAADRSDPVETFMEETGIHIAEAIFNDVERLHFTNPLVFDSPESLVRYWRAYNLFDPVLQDDFELAVEDHFHRHSEFTTVKKTLGVKIYAGGRTRNKQP
jgi:SAM-dependent methyltransferase